MTDVTKVRRIVVAGAGGVGFWLTVALCRDLPDYQVEVWDDDTFEGGSGALRLPRVMNPQMLKVDFLRGFVQMAMGDQSPHVFKQRLTGDLVDVWGYDRASSVLVVDATDMGQTDRTELWDVLRRRDVARMRISYDGNGYVTVSHGPPIEQLGARGGYELRPSLAQSLRAGGVGAEVVAKYLRTGTFDEVNFHI